MRLAIVIGIIAALHPLQPVGAAKTPGKLEKLKMLSRSTYERGASFLAPRDHCDALPLAASHGYQVKEYTVTTKDNYVLTLHRIIHPADARNGTGEPRARAKKPYLLLHGLVGTSASYLRNTPPDYQAPAEPLDLNPLINEGLWSGAGDYEFTWRSAADHLDEPAPAAEKERLWKRNFKETSAYVTEIDFDADPTAFAREFKQSHRKFNLPKAAKGHISSSLALTLANFGYDVWLLNLRGNTFSRKYNGRYSADHAEYWDFNIDTLVREDLLASVNFVERTSQWPGPMGLVAYSYSSAHVLRLLTSYPSYQSSLQPVVLLAPTLLTLTPERAVLKHVTRLVTKLFMSHNGPFPAIGRMKEDRVEKFICRLPLASKLCSLLETILYGRPRSLPGLVLDDRQTALVRQDTSCGQTSKQVLYQLIENLSQTEIAPDFSPFTRARVELMRGKRLRRSVMLFHSEADQVATMSDVAKIRDSALRLLTLSDYVIKAKHFDHSDFLFGRDNRYLLNAEVVRQVRLFDFIIMYSTPGLTPFGATKYQAAGKSQRPAAREPPVAASAAAASSSAAARH